jgi:hypothetical protein
MRTKAQLPFTTPPFYSAFIEREFLINSKNKVNLFPSHLSRLFKCTYRNPNNFFVIVYSKCKKFLLL